MKLPSSLTLPPSVSLCVLQCSQEHTFPFKETVKRETDRVREKVNGQNTVKQVR